MRHHPGMTRNETVEHLRKHKAVLAERFGVTRLVLFGSTARDEATAASDVDILVAFDGPATASRYFGVQFYLEDLLGRPVDLVTDKALRKRLRPFVERDAIAV
jgi:predicted nucleotidyltransferase